MRLRTFTGHDMPSAMKMVRDAMGDHAIILATEPLKGRKGISVTAAIEEEDVTFDHPPVATHNRQEHTATDNLRIELQNVLSFHNVPDQVATKIIHKASSKELGSIAALHQISANRDDKPLVRLGLEKLLNSCFNFDPLDLTSENLRLMLVGPPGIGKTLTIARIATKLTMSKQAVTVITTDSKRAGGVEQLQAYTNILDLPLLVANTPLELVKHIKSIPQGSQIVIDTSGCNPYNMTELDELKSFATTKSFEPVLVLPAGGDSSEAVDMVEAFSILPIKRLLVTRADTARRFGGILAAAATQKLAFCNVSNSSSIIDTLEPLEAPFLAQMLLRYQLQTK